MSDRRKLTPMDSVNAAQTAYQVDVHAAYAEERERIIGALQDEQDMPSLRIAAKLATCCRDPLVFTNEAGDSVQLRERRCRSRACPRCSKFRARELYHRMLAATLRMDSRRFLTLTIAHNDDPLADRLQHLRSSFARLRRSRIWRERVSGGIYAVEVTINRSTGQWHPHLHAIIDGDYVPHDDLKAAWIQATGDSSILRIQACPSAARAANYVAKYVGKSADVAGLPSTAIAEWCRALHGARTVHTFGNLHGVNLDERPPLERTHQIQLINPSALAAAAHRDDIVAASILRELHAAAAGSTNVDQQMLVSRIRTWSTLQRELQRRSPDLGARAGPGALIPI